MALEGLFKCGCILPNEHCCFETVKEAALWLDYSTALYTLAFQCLMTDLEELTLCFQASLTFFLQATPASTLHAEVPLAKIPVPPHTSSDISQLLTVA